MMEHMRGSIESKWQATDLGKPSKIIGIEIKIMPEYLRIYISREVYRKFTSQGEHG
jgi:hypothetical protein